MHAREIMTGPSMASGASSARTLTGVIFRFGMAVGFLFLRHIADMLRFPSMKPGCLSLQHGSLPPITCTRLCVFPLEFFTEAIIEM